MNTGIVRRPVRIAGIFAAGLAVGLAAATGFVLAARMPGGRLAAGPLLQNATPDGFTVDWWFPGTGQGELRIRGGAGQEAVFPAHRKGDRWEARAEGLAPGKAYRYEIQERTPEGTRRLSVGQARTAPPPGSPFSFLVFADSGSGKKSQYRLASVMDRYPPDLVLHAGDLVYGDVSPGDYERKFFRPYRNLLCRVPFYPVLGNHDLLKDAGRSFLETFSLPANGPASLPPQHCYWFDYGDARFVAVDSTLAPEILSERVSPWLRDVLRASDRRWKIVFFHHPPWEGGIRAGDGNVRDHLVPAIEESGTDVVFCGHNHLYERMRPMRAGQVVSSNGVLYVTSGAGGKSLHKEMSGGSPRLAAYDDSQHSFTWVRVDADRIELSQIGERDEVLDQISLEGPGRNPASVNGIR